MLDQLCVVLARKCWINSNVALDQFKRRATHYALLVALDRHRSITRAATQLALTQPTVTRALADIESIFSTPLFVRHRRGLEPTAAGVVVLARARTTMADNAALLQELDAVGAGRQGRLRLGVIPYVSTQALHATWQHLFALRPRLALSAHEDTSEKLIEAVRSRSLDCAICRFSHSCCLRWGTGRGRSAAGVAATGPRSTAAGSGPAQKSCNAPSSAWWCYIWSA